MLNTLFETEDLVEIRCLHKDQIMVKGKADPAPVSMWGTIDQLRARASELHRINNNGYNIYFGVNPRDGQSRSAIKTCRSLVVDIDHMSVDEAQAWLDVLMAEWCVPLPSLTISSGNGVHYYWRLATELVVVEWHKHQKALIATMNLSGRIADPVIHDGPRIMRLTGFVNHKGGNVASVVNNNYSQHPIEAFAMLLDNLAPAPTPSPTLPYSGDNAHAIERALKYHELRAGCKEGGRNAECYKIAACCLNDFGLGSEDTEHVINVWNQKNSPPLHGEEIREVIGKARKHSASSPNLSKDRPPRPKSTSAPRGEVIPAPPESEQDFEPAPPRSMSGVNLDTVGYMVENYVLIAGTTEVWDLEHGLRMPAAALALLYPSEFKHWRTDSCRQVVLSDNLVFSPSGEVADGQINTFQGFDFQRDNRPCPLLISHLEHLCGGDDKILHWVISWCALQVQSPGAKMATSIIMHGKQGTGKSMFWECFGKIFDPYFTIIDQCLLEADFNGWASRKLFVLAEEVLASQSKSRHKNIIKQMVTGGEITINEKQIKPWREKCYMNMVFNSNNRLPMLLDEDDRRFMVVRCDSVQSEQYYRALADEIKDEGPARLYNFLKEWDLQGFDAHTKPIPTTAKIELIKITRDTGKTFLDEWLADEIVGLPCCAAERQDLYDAYVGFCRATGLRCNSRNHFYSVIDEDYPQLTPKKTAYSRCYVPDHKQDSSVSQFKESLRTFLGTIQDRKV